MDHPSRKNAILFNCMNDILNVFRLEISRNVFISSSSFGVNEILIYMMTNRLAYLQLYRNWKFEIPLITEMASRATNMLQLFTERRLLGETKHWITTHFSLRLQLPYRRKETDIVRSILKWYHKQNLFSSKLHNVRKCILSPPKRLTKYTESIWSLWWLLLFILCKQIYTRIQSDEFVYLLEPLEFFECLFPCCTRKK